MFRAPLCYAQTEWQAACLLDSSSADAREYPRLGCAFLARFPLPSIAFGSCARSRRAPRRLPAEHTHQEPHGPPRHAQARMAGHQTPRFHGRGRRVRAKWAHDQCAPGPALTTHPKAKAGKGTSHHRSSRSSRSSRSWMKESHAPHGFTPYALRRPRQPRPFILVPELEHKPKQRRRCPRAPPALLPAARGRMHEPTKALLDAACCDRSGDRSDRMHRRVFEATQTPQSILPRQIWNSIPARPLRHTSCASSPLSNFRSRPDGAFGAESRTTLLDSDWDSTMQCHETS